MKYQIDDVVINNDEETVTLSVGDKEKRMSARDALLIGQFLMVVSQSILAERR